MSTIPEVDLDLEKLFLPAWAQEAPASQRYAGFSGGEREDRGGDRPRGRPGQGRGRPGFGQGQGRPPSRGPQGQGDRRGGPRPQGRGGERTFSHGPDRRERPETPPPLPEVNASLVPEDKGVEFLARQIKTTGRAYPLFGIAQLILQKPERYLIRFSVKKKADGQVAQPLFVCALDDTLWMGEDEAVAHVLKIHFATFYQAERTATEPPKGKYTFVAQCGLSGVILGPPNHHDYQNQLRKLHAERFARMPFDAFKARVKIVRDEEVVKKWVEEQSWKTEYVCLNMPEPLKLAGMEEVEKHFRTVHKEIIIKPVESHLMNGVAARGIRSRELARLARYIYDEQKRFPLQIATVLSQQFANHGLQFFKVNKTVTHVSVARPHFLDLETNPVSDGIKRIVEYINGHPKTTRRRLMEALAPAPQAAVIEIKPDQPQPAEPAEATPEQTAVISDLHWLIHQGHVIEFANGILETAKKPLPRPQKPEAKPKEVSPEAATQEPAADPQPAEPVETATVETSAISEPVTADVAPPEVPS